MREAFFEGFCEIFLEVSTIDLVVFVITADGLAPVPCQFLLVLVESK
jgi:hypothetical protein